MKKYLVVGLCVAVSVLVLSSVAASGIEFTGFFKAFDKTISPGENYEKNITVRKYYNMTFRFRKDNSTSDLSFTGSNITVLLKDSSGSVLFSGTGVEKGKMYTVMEVREINAIHSVSAYGMDNYMDVVDQALNGDLSFTGTSAYLTIRVSNMPYSNATIHGYVVDGLTGELVANATVYAFENDAETSSTPVAHCLSGPDGLYSMDFEIDSKKSLDIYVEGYYAS